MEATECEIEYYVTEDGKIPFQEWVLSLKDSRASKILLGRLSKEGRMKPSVPYRPFLLEELKDKSYAAIYLDVVMEDGDMELFLLALRNVTAAQGGMSRLAQKTKIGRETLYKMLSRGGNPGIFNLQKILDALGFKLTVLEKAKRRKIQRARLKKAA